MNTRITRSKATALALRQFTFPLEILEHFVKCLADQGETATVKAWSLTCRSLLPPCRSHIFETVKLKASTPYWYEGQEMHIRLEAITRFERLLDLNPDIAFYVRDVHYCVRNIDLDDQRMPALFRRLSRVRSLTLSSRIRHFDPRLDWTTMSVDLQRVLLRIIQSPSLNKLHLSAIYNFPLNAFSSAVNLAYLELHYTSFAGWVDGDNVSIGRPHRLRSLVLRNLSGENVRTLIQAKQSNGALVVDCTGISDFHVKESHHRELEVAKEVLQIAKCTQTVSLYAIQGHGPPYFQDIIQSNTLNTLKNFAATVSIGDSGISISDPLLKLCDEFEKWAGHNHIEQIDLTLIVESDADCPLGAVWERLNCLTNEDKFPVLRHLSLDITIHMWKWAEHIRKALEEQRSKEFKELLTSKRIDFRFSVRVDPIELGKLSRG
ncbi:hypothetical protein B0H34DRAFT_693475 [Crassisporium funariophilum]|nr:hypothetical protein B0H34DRAFT_693475 [Crassisporium funariophilum]